MENQKIKRSEFAKIYAMACDGWVYTLDGVLNEQKFEVDITITNDLANRMFKDANEKQTKILSKIIKKPVSIFDKVNSYEDALILNGDKCTIQKGDTPDEIAYKHIKAITKALNGGKTVDKAYAMANYIYANYFYFASAGLGCVDSNDRVSASDATYGFRLCFFTREAAEYAAEKFKDLYEQFYSA